MGKYFCYSKDLWKMTGKLRTTRLDSAPCLHALLFALFVFWWGGQYWGINSDPHAVKAGAMPSAPPYL